jgi:ABC-type transporter Mla subunit MlaD
MIRKAIVSLLCLAVMTVSALAAGAAATVKAVDGDKVIVNVTGEKAAWLKKGAAVKVKGVAGKVAEMDGSTVTIKMSKPSDLKAGAELEVERARGGSQGC